MDKNTLERLLSPYNAWWSTHAAASIQVPDYERPIVSRVLADLRDIPQVISITGPRRVGKSTAVLQVIRNLISQQNVSPEQIVYFSFDDPEVFASEETQRTVFDQMVARQLSKASPAFFFLDEIQRLPRWELFLKKYYDLKTPIRFVVSGSASSPIFRKSQESLLGRIKDHHLLPFSFREYCHYHQRHNRAFSEVLADCQLRPSLLDGDGEAAVSCLKELHAQLEPFRQFIDEAVVGYCLEGGFPEVWEMPDDVRKIEYLMEQQIRKVLYEDLMMLTKYRKPENVLRFFVYLLANPGVEINTARLAQDTGVDRQVIDDNLPRLEKTDLIIRIQKFSHKPLRVRQGNIKTYPVDMALRNAVLKNWSLDPRDSVTMGLYAENLVIRELITWPEIIEVSYYRQKDIEVDFVVTHSGDSHLPIEVKHRNRAGRISGLEHFADKYKPRLGIVITRDTTPAMDRFLRLPLRYFLLVS